MKHILVFVFVLFLSSCVLNRVPDHGLPVHHRVGIDSELLVFKTDDIRIADVEEFLISYEYNDRNIKLSQLGEHAKRFCQGKGRDTVLIDMKLTNRHNFRRATFECQEHPVLVPKY